MLASNRSCCTIFFMAIMLHEPDILDVLVRYTQRTLGGFQGWMLVKTKAKMMTSVFRLFMLVTAAPCKDTRGREVKDRINWS